MNILITGSEGQLGHEIATLADFYKNYNFFLTDKHEVDICDKEAVANYVISNNIQTIVNCAAYTAVDKAESEPQLADIVNHVAVRNLAEISKRHGIQLIHISTDYVFGGTGCTPYAVDHPIQPSNIYGETKRRGEEAMESINPPNSIIIRTSWLYSSSGNNFVKTMLRLSEEKEELHVVYDQIGTPTYARDLAKFILDHAIGTKRQKVTLYHYSNEGVCSWYDLAQEIMNIRKKTKCKVKPINSWQFPTPAKRPFYSVLDKTTLKRDFAVKIPYWKESLKECLDILQQEASHLALLEKLKSLEYDPRN